MAREFGLQIDRAGFDARWSGSVSGRGPVGRAETRRTVAPIYQELLRCQSDAVSRV